MTAEVSLALGLFDVTAKEDSSVSLSAKQPFCKESDFSREITPPKVATCEPAYWRLDGSFQAFPDEPAAYDWGFWSATNSDTAGQFATPPQVTVTFSGNHSSAGLTLHFDAYGGNYAEEVAIKWLDGNNTLLHSQSFQPDGPHYFCEAKVEHYQKLVLTFGKSHKPQHYFKLQAIDYGIQKHFGPQEVVSLSMLEEIDATADALPINSLRLQLYSADDDFAILNPGGMYTLLQQRQPMYPQIRRNGVTEPLGVFYLEQWQSDQERLVTLTGQCGLGLLDKTIFYGGMYQEKPVTELLAEIAACGGLGYELDESLAAATVTGWLPLGSPRQALQQLAFAIGAVADCSRSETLRLYPLPQTSQYTIELARQQEGQRLTLLPLVTGVEVTAHQYRANDRESQLFSGELPLGRQEITFSQPAHSLSINSAGRF